MLRKLGALLLGCLLGLCLSSVAYAADGATLTFGEGGIAETQPGSGYTISGTTLTITAAGTYTIGGSCDEGSIVVKGSLSDVTLVLSDLSLSSSTTAPVVVKKGSSVTMHLDGDSTLVDAEDAATEDTNEDFEGACIKVKSGASVRFCGDGTLVVNGDAKNAIKGAAESSLVFDGGTYEVTAANNGIAADGKVTINAGAYHIDVENDGIKSVPEADDEASEGSIAINGGTFVITAGGDGIQAETDLTINDGDFEITTLDGYQSRSFDADTMSCKGIKASGDREIENNLVITGGTFDLDCADDAVHSDAYATITGGTLRIHTADDGVHADTSLTVGAEGGLERDPEIYVYASYEGLEAGTVYIYGGKSWVVASDDGINAAGGSSSGTDGGFGPGGDSFTPGGGPGGRPGGGWGWFGVATGGDEALSASGYALYIYGGDVYVNCTGDGLDSNGAIGLYGGNVTVLSQGTGGDNSPLDADGTILLQGATVFCAGTNSMNESPSGSSQKFSTSTARLAANTTVSVRNGPTTLYTERLPRHCNYLLYSSPDVSGSVSFATGGSVDACNSNAWAHAWDEGAVTTAPNESTAGVRTFTCTSCGETERKTIPAAATYGCDGHDASTGGNTDTATDEGYAVTFSVGEGAKVNIYYTQDYGTPDETGVTSAVSRNADTGQPDSSGDGQVNFGIVLEDGYELASAPTVTGSYKNLKDQGDGIYRVTKVASGLSIAIETTAANDTGADDTTEDPAVDDAATVFVYRMYNTKTSEHLYTLSAAEYGSCGWGAYADWRQEGLAWVAPASSATPVYRLYNKKSGDHHYTTSAHERDTLVAQGDWRSEGVAFYSDDAQSVPVYRMYNGGLRRGQHHYTTSANERNTLVASHGWRDEGVGFYAVSAQ